MGGIKRKEPEDDFRQSGGASPIGGQLEWQQAREKRKLEPETRIVVVGDGKRRKAEDINTNAENSKKNENCGKYKNLTGL